VTRSTYDDLLEVDVAAGFRRQRGLTLETCPKHTIPLLEDVLRLVMGQEKTRVSIQPKTDCVPDAVGLVQRLGAERWVGFNDGHLEWMTQVKRLAPQIPVFWDRSDSDLDEDLRIARDCGFEALVLHHSVVTKEKVDKIHRAGKEAGAWTVNDEARMRWLLDLGVDRIYTDDPRRLLALKR